MTKLTKTLEKLFWILSVFYFIISFHYFFNLPAGKGDELLFLNDLKQINNEGWIEAIKENISIPFMLISYPLSKLFPSLIALRIANLILFVLLIFYFHQNKLLKHTLHFLLFYIATIGYFFLGSNDALFFISMVIFLNEANFAASGRKVNIKLAFTAIIICFFTRELFIVFLPIIITGFYIILSKQKVTKPNLLFPLLLFLVMFGLNIPSLLEKGTLSYDRKSPPNSVNVTWTQRQYLAQLMVNRGELKNFQHPSWSYTQNYVDVNGQGSLPDGVINGLLKDPKLTFIEFFKDLKYIIVYSTRSVGLILLIVIGFSLLDVLKSRNQLIKYYIPFTIVLMIIIFSTIIISYIELRWLAPIFMMLIIYYGELLKNRKILKEVKLSNILFFCFLAIYGIYRVSEKII